MADYGTYKGAPIIDSFKTRLVPLDSSYPDCECYLVLTEHHLYVLEDNFNGTYNEHFDIYITQLKAIGIYRSTKLEEVTSDTGTGKYTAVALALFAGVVVMPGKSTRKHTEEFIRLTYQNVNKEVCYLFLRGVPWGVKKFIKKCERKAGIR